MSLGGGSLEDGNVVDLCAALEAFPAVSKLDLRNNPRLTPRAGAAVVRLAEAQVKLVLAGPLAVRLRSAPACRRLHGLGEAREGYGCVRRLKLDPLALLPEDEARLRRLEPLLDYCNAKLTMRDAFFAPRDGGGVPVALRAGARAALPANAARGAVAAVRARAKMPPSTGRDDLFGSTVPLDVFEAHCEQLLVKHKGTAAARVETFFS